MPIGLITGGSGFIGRHLVRQVDDDPSPGWTWITIGRRPMPSRSPGAFRVVDLGDRAQVAGLIRDLAPSAIFHLAGRTPPASPDEFYQGNTLATVHLLDALRELGSPCRVVVAGSAAELGPVPIVDLPVGESYPCRPVDPYGLSKYLATAASLAARSPLEVVVARIFNPIGPGLPGSQALGRFASFLASGSGPITLDVGDLEARRDFVDVRDVARALVLLANSGTPGRVYHVGTGRSRRVGDGLDRLIALSGREVRVVVGRPASGPSDSRADINRLVGATGWAPDIAWEESLGDLWADAVGRRSAGLTDGTPPV